MGRRTWIKIYAEKWLRGTLREESSSLRGIWMDILALAGDSAYGDVGKIQAVEGIGYPDELIKEILKVEMKEWEEAKGRLCETQRIVVSKKNVIEIMNWGRYQSEYDRQRSYRQELQPKVTTESATKSYKTIEKEKEKKNITTASKKTKQTNPLIKKFIDWWFVRFEEKFGDKYHVLGGKDGMTVKRLLATYEYEKLVALAEKFFETEDEFVEKVGYTIGMFSSTINRLIVGQQKEEKDARYFKR